MRTAISDPPLHRQRKLAVGCSIGLPQSCSFTVRSACIGGTGGQNAEHRTADNDVRRSGTEADAEVQPRVIAMQMRTRMAAGRGIATA